MKERQQQCESFLTPKSFESGTFITQLPGLLVEFHILSLDFRIPVRIVLCFHQVSVQTSVRATIKCQQQIKYGLLFFILLLYSAGEWEWIISRGVLRKDEIWKYTISQVLFIKQCWRIFLHWFFVSVAVGFVWNPSSCAFCLRNTSSNSISNQYLSLLKKEKKTKIILRSSVPEI